ncbi:MAG TPA: glycoside hydrolase family 10, partial [Candidatus Hydrogenedentes bacterium]|nr:glycoside hydrolase family 10 [Candidatus Hydrogenedentota bacterium]
GATIGANATIVCGVTLGRTWQEYFLPFKSREAYEAGRASAGFHLGVMAQCVEIADVALYAFGTGYDLARLPRTRISYAGQALDAPWRAVAAARIEQHRKADLAVRVTDSTGRPVPGAKVAVEMRRHAFGWGSAVTVKGILRQDADGEKYRGCVSDS